MKPLKPLFIVVIIVILKLNTQGQVIPNGCLEVWPDTTYPLGWSTPAISFPSYIPGLAARDTADKFEGKSSIKLVSQFVGNPNIVPGFLTLGPTSFSQGSLHMTGIPFTHRPDTLFFAYKYEPAGNDTAGFDIQLLQANGNSVLAGGVYLPSTNGLWQNVFVPLNDFYTSSDIPDTLKLLFTSSYQTFPQAGSILHVDAINFDNVTSGCTSLALVTGKVFWDVNQNQVQDPGEAPATNKLVKVGTSSASVTNKQGNYAIYVEPGQHTIKLALNGNETAFTTSPDSTVIQVNDASITYGNNNFAIVPPPGYCEGDITIISLSPARPGFSNEVRLSLSNQFSSNPTSQTINFHYDAAQRFAGVVSPQPTTIDTLNRLLSWNVSNLTAGSNWQATVFLYTPPSVSLGSLLTSSADVDGSGCQGFDTLQANLTQTVIGAYDPNDKSVSPVGEGPSGNVAPATADLTYTIRFQNTGTYLAETVRIEDTISANVNLNSLEVIASSHNYEVLVNGRQVTFQFNNINLPDSTSNEPGSHGYVQYRVKLLDGLSVGTQTKNTAYIFFDFNAPIVTNTTITTLALPTSIQSIRSFETPMVVYPNPNNGTVLISVEEDWLYAVGTVTDLSGRKVIDFTMLNKEETLDLTALSTGMYVVRIVSQPLGHCSQKLLIQK